MQPIDFKEHPEGGRFREVFRSANAVTLNDGTVRSSLTHIYFSLKTGEVSCFHKVASDEVWNLYQGKLSLYIWDGTNTQPEIITLASENNSFCYVVPAGFWQAAEQISKEVLVGCSVAPGFEFSDFILMNRNSEDAKKFMSIAPGMAKYILS